MMKLRYASIGFALLTALPASAHPAFAWPVYTVASSGGGLGFIDKEVTIFSRVQNPARDSDVIWIAERRRNNQRLRKTIADHQWIDGRKCPALLEGLEALGALPAMKIGAPSTMVDTLPVSDAPLTTLRGPPDSKQGSGVRLSRSEYLGPVVEWRVKLQKKVEGCWQDEPVMIPGVEVIPRLSTEADLETWMR